MLAIKAHTNLPPALVDAVVAHARRTGQSLEWVERVLADPWQRFAFLGRDEPETPPVRLRQVN